VKAAFALKKNLTANFRPLLRVDGLIDGLPEEFAYFCTPDGLNV
jgi:hypothetical protein